MRESIPALPLPTSNLIFQFKEEAKKMLQTPKPKNLLSTRVARVEGMHGTDTGLRGILWLVKRVETVKKSDQQSTVDGASALWSN